MGGSVRGGLLGSMLATSVASSALAADQYPSVDARRGSSAYKEPAPSFGFTALGGLAYASCMGESRACGESPNPAPSFRALVLYQPNGEFGVGLLGRIASYHWKVGFIPFRGDAAPEVVESTVTTGLVGPAVRVNAFPSWRVSPVFEFAAGAAFQSESRKSSFSCNSGAFPGAEVALGGSARAATWASVLVMASASAGLAFGCSISDGAPVTPFLGTGFGLHAGVSFDVQNAPR